MDKELKGRRCKNASGRATYEIYNAGSDFLKQIAAILKSRFGFAQHGETLVGADEVYMDFTNGSTALVLGWDNWSGCFLFAQQPEGDACVAAVGDCLDTVLNAC